MSSKKLLFNKKVVGGIHLRKQEHFGGKGYNVRFCGAGSKTIATGCENGDAGYNIMVIISGFATIREASCICFDISSQNFSK